MTLEKLRRYKVWLQRIGCSRGFGVQSPSAYSFVRYVINEHYPYYAYEELLGEYPEISVITRRKGEFLFRLSNFLQYEYCYMGGDSESCFSTYISYGCRKTIIRSFNVGMNAPDAALYILSQKDVDLNDFSDFIDSLPDNSVIFINGLLKEERTKAVWNIMMQHKRISFSFDMYYCGVAFMNPKTPKQNFIINF